MKRPAAKSKSSVPPQIRDAAQCGRRSLADFVKVTGGRFSTELGIDIESGKSSEIFRWFLAAILFGARISGRIATKTYQELVKEGLVSANKILRRGWSGLVRVLDRGGYARYDFKTATKLLEVCRALVDEYAGDLNNLHAASENPRDLEYRVKELGKGIGEVTAGIFLREMRGIWPKAEPLPSDLVLLGARKLGLLPKAPSSRAHALRELKTLWIRENGPVSQFANFEAALVRYGLAIRKTHRSLDSSSNRSKHDQAFADH
jgi:endonuclease III